jgi:THO complex subunit 1 transcription elongation factor
LVEFLKASLDRESIWVKWKNRGCPASNPADDLTDQILGTPLKPGRRPRAPPRKQSVSAPLSRVQDDDESAAEDGLDKMWKRKRWDIDGQDNRKDPRPDASKRHRMTAEELTDEWSALRYEDRAKMLLSPDNLSVLPSVDQYQAELRQDMEDELEDEYCKRNNAAYVWRCMRALSAQRCDIFMDMANPETHKPFRSFDLRRLISEPLGKDSALASEPVLPVGPET